MITRIVQENTTYTIFSDKIKIQKRGIESYKVIEIPKKARGKEIKVIDDKLTIGNYVLNEEKDIFEKIGGWLTFLQNILILIKNLFKKNN